MTYLVAAMAGALTLWALWSSVADRAVALRQLFLAAGVELGLLAQMVVAVVGLARGHDLNEPLTFWGYLVVALLLLPGAAAWAVAERTRWSSVVLLVAAVAIMAMQARLWQVWST